MYSLVLYGHLLVSTVEYDTCLRRTLGSKHNARTDLKWVMVFTPHLSQLDAIWHGLSSSLVKVIIIVCIVHISH